MHSLGPLTLGLRRDLHGRVGSIAKVGRSRLPKLPKPCSKPARCMIFDDKNNISQGVRIAVFGALFLFCEARRSAASLQAFVY
jgi:hypothetical protein